MPRNNPPITKQYVVQAVVESRRASPQTPTRGYLLIQNTGANPGLFRLVDDVRRDGGDVLINAGAVFEWDNPDTTPREALNFASDLGTTFAIIEGLLK